MGKSVRIGAFVAFVIACGATRAVAASFSVGSRITISPTTFAVPIDISDAVNLSSWTFDLTYDPADVQVNTGCDPSSDVYCSLLFGPVTEGDFFASGAPFNLLIPGVLDLDPITLAQTGHLFAVNGAYGGIPPAPSGSGTLAFVEFTELGNGGRPILVSGTATPVPEPGALVMVTVGVLSARFRQKLGVHSR